MHSLHPRPGSQIYDKDSSRWHYVFIFIISMFATYLDNLVVVAVLVIISFTSIRYLTLKRRIAKGCQPITRTANREPFLGLDLIPKKHTVYDNHRLSTIDHRRPLYDPLSAHHHTAYLSYHISHPTLLRTVLVTIPPHIHTFHRNNKVSSNQRTTARPDTRPRYSSRQHIHITIFFFIFHSCSCSFMNPLTLLHAFSPSNHTKPFQVCKSSTLYQHRHQFNPRLLSLLS